MCRTVDIIHNVEAGELNKLPFEENDKHRFCNVQL